MPGDEYMTCDQEASRLKTDQGVAWVGRVLMSLATAIYGFVPLAVDFTDTHVFHPQWTGHARFHTVWLLVCLLFIAVMALHFIWARQHDAHHRLHLAGLLGVGALGSFFVSAATMAFYGGSLHDHGGVDSGVMGMDANLAGFSAAFSLLLTGWFLAHRGNLPGTRDVPDPW
jgi:hypothetical protein